MRIRHKPWAKPELESCSFYVAEPQKQIGHWRELFDKPEKPLYVELGCGKGGFISQAAPAHPEVNFIAMDIKNEMLVLAKRKLEEAFKEKGTVPDGNVRIAIQNIERLELAWDENDRADRIYINFCNPWPKKKHKNRRLTPTRQLMNYKKFLRGGKYLADNFRGGRLEHRGRQGKSRRPLLSLQARAVRKFFAAGGGK